MDIEDINLAINKKFTDFSTKIKSELSNKLQNHDDMVIYSAEIDKIKKMKDIFAGINKPAEA